jgi:hypothetical protein
MEVNMRLFTVVFFIITITALGGCRSLEGRSGKPATANNSVSDLSGEVYGRGQQGQGQQGRQEYRAATVPAAQSAPAAPKPENISVATAQSQSQVIERKIIRNADLTIELDAPEEAQRRITSIAEKHGGFVVNSESKLNDGNLQTAPKTSVVVVARVPAAKFAETIEEIQQIGGRVIYRKDAGQDVTEEFIDLEARIRAKRALESQFLEIMKRAQKVSEALEVQSQISEVRSEIERMEGRRRFLENQAALSTITVKLQTPMPIVAATTGGFWHSIKLALGDGLDTAAEIVLGLIRFVIVMIPIVLLIVLPGWLIIRWLRRRLPWPKPSGPIIVTDQAGD